MATLKTPHRVAPHGHNLTYGFDTRKLVKRFGGTAAALIKACDEYGVPRVVTQGHRITAPQLAILLELAERQHRPLDLYQYVIQER